MAGAMHRMGVYLGLVEDDDYADEGEGYGEPYAQQQQDRGDRSPARRDGYADTRYSRETHHEAGSRRASVDTLPPREYDDYAEYQPAGYEITALHPRTYNEARTIGEAFRASTPVTFLGGLGRVDRDFDPSLEREDAERWVLKLVPKNDPSLGTLGLTVRKRDASIEEARVTDPLGTTTRIAFSNEDRNGKVDPGLFRFSPPDGVDVVKPPAY
jgi:hypothetical protein